MIRTVWLAIAFLIGLAALTVIKVGTQSFVQEAVAPSDQTVGTNLASDMSEPQPLAKSDRLDAAEEEDAARPVKPIAIAVAAEPASPKEAGRSERGWRNSYAKRQASASRHHRGKSYRTSRRHHGHVASRSHRHSKHAMSHKQKKSRRG